MQTLPVRVLIVDDLPRVRDALVTLLATYSEIEVVGVASNGREAVQLAKKLRPNVVLMDLEMPVMDGYEATRTIAPDGPAVIALSIHTDTASRTKALACGACAFVEKGVAPGDLVHTLLEGYRRVNGPNGRAGSGRP